MLKIYFLLSLLIVTPAYSQSLDSIKTEKFPKRVVSDLSNFGKSVAYTYARPLKWQKKEWATLGVVFGTTIAVSLLDEEINSYFKRNQTHFQDQLASVGDFLGQPEYQGPFMLALWGVGVSANNPWMRETGLMLAASMTTSGLLQTFLKEAVGRARPNKGEGSTSFKPFGGKDYHSFPSGHTMLALSTSWVLARQVNYVPLKILFYSIAPLVGWSRLYDNAHWASDIVLGSALGIACAEAVIRYYENLKEKNKVSHLMIIPKGNSASLIYSF